MQITLIKDKKDFIVTFDKHGDVDTVECQGVQLPRNNSYVLQIQNNLEDIEMRNFPTGGFSRKKK